MKFILLLIAALASAAADAHDNHDAPGEAAKPLVGQVSEEVAIERVRTLGFQNVRVRSSQQDKPILIDAMQEGAPVLLRVNRQDGVVTDAALKRQVTEPLPNARHLRIEGAQVPVSDSLPLRPMAPGR